VVGKNIRPLAGKPLIAWSIETAKQCPSVDSIVVSTDGEDIAQVARENGAEVPFLRPPELARDDTLQVDAIRHAVLELEGKGARYDLILLLQPTAPLRRPEDVEGCIAMMRDTKANTVISVAKVEDGAPGTLYERDGAGRLRAFLPPPPQGTLRQTIATFYVRTGSVYLMTRDLVVERRAIYGDDVRGYICPPETAFNIDSEFDWELTEAWLAWQERKHA
jgi:CMP-N-acetylneuraminic acid synthetase